MRFLGYTLANEAEIKAISIKHELSSDYLVYFDPSKIKQAFVHLLSNAVKFNAESGTVRVSATHEPNGDLVVSIFSRTDLAPVPHDVIAAPGWPEDDIKLIVPLYDRHFLHSGITYGANEPAIADSGVTVNGVAIAAKH